MELIDENYYADRRFVYSNGIEKIIVCQRKNLAHYAENTGGGD